jgi:hypothetical protein
MAADELDIESRELCPDGACIGVIGSDGLCKVCGKAGMGTPFRGSIPGLAESVLVEPKAEPVLSAANEESTELDDDARKLCPDGTCIGVIGPDGLCKICGARG